MFFYGVLGLILWFIASKEGKIPNPKKVHAIVNMLRLTNPQQIQVFNGMA
jgi:membrane protease YdiL (CAAX protease family)